MKAQYATLYAQFALDKQRHVSARAAAPETFHLPHDCIRHGFLGSSVDTVVTTWTLCAIPNVMLALAEMRRVLRPDGRLLFVEHGLSPDASVRRWQDGLTPLWKRLGGGCHLNRAISQIIQDAGFRIDRVETGYMKGLKPMTFMYEGFARPR